MTWQDGGPAARHVHPLTPRRAAHPAGAPCRWATSGYIYGGLGLLLALSARLRRVFHGPTLFKFVNSPVDAQYHSGCCRGALWFMGLPRITQVGTPMPQGGAAGGEPH